MDRIHLPDTLTKALTFVGAATTCYALLKTSHLLYTNVRPSTLPKYRHGPEPWALVTGATAGIGFGFAQELCSKGFNVFLHGRNRSKLLQRQQDLAAEFPHVQTKIIVYDAESISKDIDNIAAEIGDANLTVLVNNLGGDSTAFPPVDQTDYEYVARIININAASLAHITRVILPILKKNGPALILNISSYASFGFPFLATYSATKGFVDSFTHAVNAEAYAQGSGVEVMAYRVGQVQSQGMDVDVSFFSPSSRHLARSALGRVGCGQPLVYGYFPHAIQGVIFDVLPRWMVDSMTAKELQRIKADSEGGKRQKKE